MPAFYDNPVQYPPKFRVRRYGNGLYVRSTYVGTIDGEAQFAAVSLHETASDAANNVNIITDLKE